MLNGGLIPWLVLLSLSPMLEGGGWVRVSYRAQAISTSSPYLVHTQAWDVQTPVFLTYVIVMGCDVGVVLLWDTPGCEEMISGEDTIKWLSVLREGGY